MLRFIGMNDTQQVAGNRLDDDIQAAEYRNRSPVVLITVYGRGSHESFTQAVKSLKRVP